MKLITFYLIFSFFFIQSLFPQEFMLSDIPAENYTIDKFSQTVYAKDLFSDTVREINLRTMELTNTNYQILPAFENTKHVAAYALKKDTNPDHYEYEIYLHDFQTDSTWLLIDSAGYLYNLEGIMKFSPNDRNLFYANNYFSFDDSSKQVLQNIGLGPIDLPKWNSDSSLIYISNSNSILQYSLNSKKIDTLVLLGQYDNISGYDYNKKYNILAYSKDEDYPKIFFHYENKQVDSIIFDSKIDSNFVCWQEPVSLRSLSWSPDESKLAFFSFHLTNSIAGIYTYDLNTNKMYNVTDCIDGGLKYFLHWANNDTIIFNNTTSQRLFGFDISSVITSVNFDNNIIPLKDFIISNYPNPFNLSTKIKINYASTEPIQIKIYNILGKLVKSIEVPFEANQITWDATDNFGKIVPSGIYLVTAEISTKIKSNVIKMVLIK